MATNDIPWRPVRDIPTKPGYRLTVKRDDGELLNTVILRDGQPANVTRSELKGWIPNEQ